METEYWTDGNQHTSFTRHPCNKPAAGNACWKWQRLPGDVYGRQLDIQGIHHRRLRIPDSTTYSDKRIILPVLGKDIVIET